jgi:hypothetical protein
MSGSAEVEQDQHRHHDPSHVRQRHRGQRHH